MRPITSRVNDPPQRVCDLVNANGEWDSVILDEVFLPVDAATIRSVPICTRQVDGFWSWAHEFFLVCTRCDQRTACLCQQNFGVKRGLRDELIPPVLRERRKCG